MTQQYYKSRLLLLILVFVFCFFCAVTNPPSPSKLKSSHNWYEYQNKKTDIDKKAVASVKVIFTYKDSDKIYYLVSKKRVDKKKNRSQKHKKWEFLGGKIDSGESPVQALQRELLEEDNSQILSNHLMKTVQDKTRHKLYFQIITLDDENNHVIFLTNLPTETFEQLEAYYQTHDDKNKETYGFFLATEKFLKKKKLRKKNWTPKSQKIISHLGKNLTKFVKNKI